VSDDDPVNPLPSAPDEVTIHVRNLNDPPRCDLAFVGLDKLWPPNHKMISVSSLSTNPGAGMEYSTRSRTPRPASTSSKKCSCR